MTTCENTEYARFAGRIIRGFGRRVAEGEPVDLAEMDAVRRSMDAVMVEAVAAMRERHGWSWAEIGRELGITRQAAQQRFGAGPVRAVSPGVSRDTSADTQMGA